MGHKNGSQPVHKTREDQKQRGSNVPVLWDAGTPLLCNSVSCAVCGSWALNTGGWGIIHSDGQALAQHCSETLTVHREMAVRHSLNCTSALPLLSPEVCFIPEHYWAYSCPSWLHSAPQSCFVDSSHRGGSAAAMVLTPTLHQCAAPCLLPGSTVSLACSSRTYLSLQLWKNIPIHNLIEGGLIQ